MTDHFQRSQLLIDQGRYDLAEKELRQVLSLEPDYASAHGLLAVCLSEKKQYKEALKESSQAIALSPSHSGFHYIHAGILLKDTQLEAAKKSSLEALRLDPEDADYHARLASIQYEQTKYIDALKSAEQGLSVDAEHVWSMNIRLLSLMALGRIAEAEAEVNSTLAIAPDHPFPHTVKGWVLLHQNRIPEAMQSFREALRIEPGREWARLGLLETLKARNGLYRIILRLDLWRSSLGDGQRAVFAALMILPQTRALFILLLICIGITKSFFSFLLWFDPYGRLALNQEEIAANKWILSFFASLISGITLYCITRQVAWVSMMPIILLVVYCANTLCFSKVHREEKVKFAFLLSISIALCLFSSAFILPMQAGTGAEVLLELAGGLISLTVVGFVLFVVGLFLYKLLNILLKFLSKK
jgi:tetratricopeptide (TPR) repeat protein